MQIFLLKSFIALFINEKYIITDKQTIEMDKGDKKELEGRYALALIHSWDTYYEFTKPKYKRYDALSTGFSQEEGILSENVVDVKTYNDPKHLRFSTGTTAKIYPDFQFDYYKGDDMVRVAAIDNRRPLLECIFWDYVMAWDLNITDWRSTAEKRDTNKCGIDYGGQKEKALQAHLPLSGKQGPIWKIPTNPEELWPRVIQEIRKTYPDYIPSWETP